MAAALLSLLMLTYASVLSCVMQAQMAYAAEMGPMCSVSMAQTHTSPKTNHGRQTACPYCSAAAHAPILGSVAPLRLPAAFVFSAARHVSSHGPRGPPARQPRARGPPTDLTPL